MLAAERSRRLAQVGLAAAALEAQTGLVALVVHQQAPMVAAVGAMAAVSLAPELGLVVTIIPTQMAEQHHQRPEMPAQAVVGVLAGIRGVRRQPPMRGVLVAKA